MNDKLNDALNEISDKYLTEAETYQKRHFPYWIAAAAAIIVLIVCLIFFIPISPQVPLSNDVTHTRNPIFSNLVASPKLPQMAPHPDTIEFASYEAYLAANQAWRNDQKSQYNQPDGYADSLTNFFSSSIAQFLQGEGNTAYSPLNVYMAMAMLAETTGGNSRQQILDLFGVNSIEELRTQAGHVWNAHYSNDSKTTLTLANSMWLDHLFPYHQETADLLAQNYYASTFYGDLGTDTVNRQLQSWLNANTGGLLKDQVGQITLDPRTAFALASTVYFSAAWQEEFNEANTYNETFHTPSNDQQVPFMHQTYYACTYYRGTHFGAIHLRMDGNNRMWLILPDDGYTTEDILQSGEYLQLTLNPSAWPNTYTYDIHLSLPKFDIVQQQDLVEGMKKLGITDIFSTATADFSPLTNSREIFVDQINHAARVIIDEEGCTAAAFTVIPAPGAGMPEKRDELYFQLNRPFLFIVSSRDNLPLFAGTVKQP